MLDITIKILTKYAAMDLKHNTHAKQRCTNIDLNLLTFFPSAEIRCRTNQRCIPRGKK